MALLLVLATLLQFQVVLSQPQPHVCKLSYVGLYLYQLDLCINTDITAFTQNPEGVLAPNARVSFNCQSTVPALSWEVGGVRVTSSSDEFTIMTTRNNSLTFSSISTLAKIDLNNTKVNCVVSSSPSSSDNQSAHIIVAGRTEMYLFVTIQTFLF